MAGRLFDWVPLKKKINTITAERCRAYLPLAYYLQQKRGPTERFETSFMAINRCTPNSLKFDAPHSAFLTKTQMHVVAEESWLDQPEMLVIYLSLPEVVVVEWLTYLAREPKNGVRNSVKR
jgi:hypothetical protein